MQIEKECKKHGLTVFSVYKIGSDRCRLCLYESVKKRRKLLKRLSVDYKGGKCCRCGYDKCLSALEFHHTDPKAKEFGIGESSGLRSFEEMKIELDKCILLCSNCHREEHELLREKEDNGKVAGSIPALRTNTGH